jgi:hypothetical protein
MAGSHATEKLLGLICPTLVGSGRKVPSATSNQPTCTGLPALTGKRQFASTLTAGGGVGETPLAVEATLDVDGDAVGVTGPSPVGTDGPQDVSNSTAARNSLNLTISTHPATVGYTNSDRWWAAVDSNHLPPR